MFSLRVSAVLITLVSFRAYSSAAEESVAWAVVGSAAHLPCNITPPHADDSVYLVLWYKDDGPQPVYSYDSRGSTSKHWSENHQFGSRAVFRTTVAPAQLLLTTVIKADSGVYKCRVDFRNSPTVTQTTKLVCVEKTRKPVILDDEGVQVMGTVGPYRLRQPLILVCVGEGEPAPNLVWLMNGETYDEEMDPGVQGKTDRQRNTLVVSSLGREHAGNIFTCQAENSKLSENPETSISVSIHMPVKEARITNLPATQTVGKTYEILCQAIGSSPTPSISWTMMSASGENVTLGGALTSVSMEGNLTISRLNLTMEKAYHDRKLTCLVTNLMFLPVTATATLTVNYPPQVEISVSNEVVPGRVIEGTDLTLECRADSRPAPARFYWLKDSVLLSEDPTLLLSNTNSNDSGVYVCIVENVEGRGESSSVRVSVLYRPFCLSPLVLPHQQETEQDTPGVDLRCLVDAKPLARSYRWYFNSSAGSFEIPSAKPMMSFMNYAESKSADQGEVLCWATNDVGVQSEPCIFHVVPLGAPHPPVDCEISNRSLGSVQVACKPGFSGGLEQHFVLQVFEMINGSQTLISSNWSRDALLRVSGLQANTSYILAVHAANERGESPAVYVGGQTASFQPRLPKLSSEKLPLLYIIIALLCAVMLLSVILSITAACRRHTLIKRTQHLTQTQPILETYSERTESDPSEPLVNQETRTMERKVSFRDCYCHHGKRISMSNGTLNGARADNKHIPIEKTIVRSYSIDKLRTRCPTCHPPESLTSPGRPSNLPRTEAENLAEAEKILNNSLQMIERRLHSVQ